VTDPTPDPLPDGTLCICDVAAGAVCEAHRDESRRPIDPNRALVEDGGPDGKVEGTMVAGR